MKKVTLTFDNGPDPSGTTAFVLEELARRRILASFFVIGRQLARPGARALAERARDEGHWIGNHTLTHSIMFGDSDDDAPPAPRRDTHGSGRAHGGQSNNGQRRSRVGSAGASRDGGMRRQRMH